MISTKINQEFLDLLLDGDKAGATQIVEGLTEENIDVKTLYVDLFQDALYKVGKLWETNKIPVSVEHMATAIVEHLMALQYPKIFGTARKGKSVIITSLVNEYHQIGAKMVADVFEMGGWDSYFTGANTPDVDLVKLIDQKKPDVVGISVSIYYNIKNLLIALDKINSEFKDIPLLVGGQAFKWGGLDAISKYSNVTYLESIFAIEEYLKAS